jgi:hypothetical protein
MSDARRTARATRTGPSRDSRPRGAWTVPNRRTCATLVGKRTFAAVVLGEQVEGPASRTIQGSSFQVRAALCALLDPGVQEILHPVDVERPGVIGMGVPLLPVVPEQRPSVRVVVLLWHFSLLLEPHLGSFRGESSRNLNVTRSHLSWSTT